MSHAKTRLRAWSRLRHMPLRYRLSMAFFLLGFAGTVTLVTLAILSQNELIGQQERERLHGYARAFEYNLDLQGRWAVSLASSFARNPEVAFALAQKDRYRLIKLCYPSYLFMQQHYGITQFNFHVLPARNFLRLQRLYEFGDDLSYRSTIEAAISGKTEIFGLEEGLTGYGMRGVAPVFWRGEMIGTIEIGFSVGMPLLAEMKRQFGIEALLLMPDTDKGSFSVYAGTLPESLDRKGWQYMAAFQSGKPQLLLRSFGGSSYAVLVAAVHDYSGKTAALVELAVDRAAALALNEHYRYLLLGVGMIGLLLTVAATYLISAFFAKDIEAMVGIAQKIAAGGEVRPLAAGPSGELRLLAEALNEMLASLDKSRRAMHRYKENLEHNVQLRTKALRESEEKYRTLVESVPLVVYRLLGNGRTIFVSHFIEELMGISVQQVMQDLNFWKNKVCEDDRQRIWPLMDGCLQDGHLFRAEYRMYNAKGQVLFVMDYALPVLDEEGKVESVDGILVDVSDRRRLQQQIIQTEELRTLAEISARLAHEIRNPLVAAGGFARRLLEKLTEEDANRASLAIIVKEVARLEMILDKTIKYLRPFELHRQRTSLNALIVKRLERHQPLLARCSCGVELSLAGQLPDVLLDRDLFGKAVEDIFLALAGYCRAGEGLQVLTYQRRETVHLEIQAFAASVTDDDLEHFFYPFASRPGYFAAGDLPLAKMVVHKHQGIIELRRKRPHQIVLTITLPV
ncbi:cache domain-containing protein [Desulfoferrobacter suflitae]|uniref:cache domain-containing protein n=1 Tax=Desulfoferrobacter suflitae TaxID=2865782 RepID=UPI0021649D87|nr:cache domain-containing protein [Desulfoferrobacter suflitae]MCK8603720.1 PAS domain-containing protein [Desulfoferrobacter suflitae]